MSGQAAAKVVALLGVPGSGKSIVSRRLLQDYNFTRLRFSDAQRDMLRAGFGLADHDIDGPGRDQPHDRFGGHTVQNMMRTLGHDWGRGGLHSDIWVREWLRRLESLEGFVLSDDLQRANEAAAVRAIGGIVVRVTRPGYTPAQTGTLHRQAQIVHDLELINVGPAQLSILTDKFAAGLSERLASSAA